MAVTLRRQSLSEDVVRGNAPHRVDREKGIIYGVKVCGLKSINGRRYLLEALRKATPLYEGVAVNVNHPKKPDDPRQTDDRFGRLINVRPGEDGLYADLEFLKSHPLAERICEAAERMPELFGLSHNAQGAGENDKDGTFVVSEIVEVRSVDLVGEPATNRGIWESRGKKRMKIRAYLEAVFKRLVPKRQAIMKPILDLKEDYMDADMPAEMPNDDQSGSEPPEDAETGDPEDALWDGFVAAISAIVQDDSMDAKTKGKKIANYLMTHEKLCKSAEDEEDNTEEEDGKKKEDTEEEEDDDKKDKDKDDDKDKMKESRETKARVEELERKDKARDLIESAGLTFSDAKDHKEFLSLLLETRTPEAMQKLVDREKKSRAKVKNKPRSGTTTDGVETRVEDTVEGRMSALRV